MADDYGFFIHGVGVQIEHTDSARDVQITRSGFGAVISQSGGTFNWFHFLIPTATRLDNHNVNRYAAWLQGSVNERAVIERVTVHEAQGHGAGSPRIFETPAPGEEEAISITDRSFDEVFNLPHERSGGALLLCARVRFEVGGEICFIGAGAAFEERT